MRDIYTRGQRNTRHKAVTRALLVFLLCVILAIGGEIITNLVEGLSRDARLISFETIATATVVGSVDRLYQARRIIEKERKSTLAEERAFRAFAKDVKKIPASSSTVTATGGMIATMGGTQTDEPLLKKVRTAYRQRIIELPHYEDEYSDDLSQSLTEELNEELQIALVHGQQFSPHVKRLLIRESVAASKRRGPYLEFLSDEIKSIETALAAFHQIDEVIETVTRSHSENTDNRTPREREDKLLRREIFHCEYLIRRRQKVMQKVNYKLLSQAGPLLHENLYVQTGSRFPILDGLLSRLEILENQRQESSKSRP